MKNPEKGVGIMQHSLLQKSFKLINMITFLRFFRSFSFSAISFVVLAEAFTPREDWPPVLTLAPFALSNSCWMNKE